MEGVPFDQVKIVLKLHSVEKTVDHFTITEKTHQFYRMRKTFESLEKQ